MHDAISTTEPIHPLQTHALIYLWADPTATEVCRMDPHEQQRRCIAWAATRSWPIVAVLVDAPVSISASARPALRSGDGSRLDQDARAGCRGARGYSASTSLTVRIPAGVARRAK